MSTKPSKELVIIDNPHKGRRYQVEMEAPEFTCLCPQTGQPDFATIFISYEPRDKIVELKSLKLYLWSYRNEGHYHEAVVNKILDDLVKDIKPYWMQVIGEFYVRGGISTNVIAEYDGEELTMEK